MIAFVLLTAFFLVAGLYISVKLSPFTERMMRHIWDDKASFMKAAIARRVKELCIDGNVPEETATLMIAKEHNIMEEQVKEMARAAGADPVILHIAFGSKYGNHIVRGLKRFNLLGR
jgi:hypothetical protein